MLKGNPAPTSGDRQSRRPAKSGNLSHFDFRFEAFSRTITGALVGAAGGTAIGAAIFPGFGAIAGVVAGAILGGRLAQVGNKQPLGKSEVGDPDASQDLNPFLFWGLVGGLICIVAQLAPTEWAKKPDELGNALELMISSVGVSGVVKV
jgi:hypothetical protein